MKIGDYVRTLNGKIWVIGSQQAISGHKKDIIKSSPNIIDLIEVGDYVNGYEVEYVDYKDKMVICYGATLDEEDIKSIVTREMFESMKYEVN